MNNYEKEKKYIAIIGDIIDSQNIEDRSYVQNKLNEVLNDINSEYFDHIESTFMITLGDEFQGLITNPNIVIDIIERIEAIMSPVEFRFGVGIGTVNTNIVRESPFGMDGPAYYKAREKIVNIKKLEKKRKSLKTNIMIEIAGRREYSDLINTVLALSYLIKRDWTKNQKEAIYQYVQCGKNEKKAAKSLGITQPAINKRLTAANYYSYANAMKNIEISLSNSMKD